MVPRVLATIAVALGVLAPAASAQDLRDLRVFTVMGGGWLYDMREGIPATSLVSQPITDATVTADESILVMFGNMIWRLGNDGRLSRVMGRGPIPGAGDGGPSRSASLAQPSGLASQADGGVLIAEPGSCGVRRIGPDGIVRRVAGRVSRDAGGSCWRPTPGSELGDGGPATDGVLGQPTGVSPTDDGGFLIADSGLNRIRKVSSSGSITTVAGSDGSGPIPQPPPPYTGAAIETVLFNPSEVASLPGGAFLFVDRTGLHEVSAGGTIRTVNRNTQYGSAGTRIDGLSEAGLAFGSRWMTGGDAEPGFSVFREASLDQWFGAEPRFFTGGGNLLAEAGIGGLNDVEQLPDGGLLFVVGPTVLAALPDGTSRLGVAVSRESLRSLTHRRLGVRLTLPSSLSIEIRAGREIVARATARREPGLSFVRLPKRLPLDLYNLRVIATTADGATASSRARLIVGRGLPLRAAKLAATEIYWSDGARAADQYPYSVVRTCHRFSRRRVDCVVGEEGNSPDRFCIYVAAVVRARNGVPYSRPYRCSRRRDAEFRRAPRWTAPRRQVTPY